MFGEKEMVQRTLKIPREEALALYQQQIAMGESLLARQIRTEEELARYVEDRKRYNRVNRQMLDRIFGEREVELFWTFGFSSPSEYDDFDSKVKFYKELDARQVNELRGLQESLNLLPDAQMDRAEEKSKPSGFKGYLAANKPWLFQGVGTEVLKGVVVVVLMIASFVGGYHRRKEPEPQPPRLSSEELKIRLDQLIQGHNDRKQKLQEAIINQQRDIANSYSNHSERRQAIAELHKDLEDEETTFQNDLTTIQSLLVSKP
jgi:hypothetical protein